MTSTTVTPVILSGGAGTRLWPLSHAAMPKQFHALASELTMLQDTAKRTAQGGDGIEFEPAVVIAADTHLAGIEAQMGALGQTLSRIILEPMGRNTAAAAYIAAAVVERLDPDSLVMLLPADHVIADPVAFRRAIAAAATTARSRIVTFGITPEGPETGYGYIQQGAELAPGGQERVEGGFQGEGHATAYRRPLDASHVMRGRIVAVFAAGLKSGRTVPTC